MAVQRGSGRIPPASAPYIATLGTLETDIGPNLWFYIDPAAPTTLAGEKQLLTPRSRGRPTVVHKRHELPSSVRYGPLGLVGTIYEMPNGRRCVVIFANRGSDVLSPVRNERGELWIGHLLPGDAEPTHFDEWEREWVPAELLRPVGDLGPQ